MRSIERVRRQTPVLQFEGLPAPGMRIAEWSEVGGSLEFESSRSYLLKAFPKTTRGCHVVERPPNSTLDTPGSDGPDNMVNFTGIRMETGGG